MEELLVTGESITRIKSVILNAFYSFSSNNRTTESTHQSIFLQFSLWKVLCPTKLFESAGKKRYETAEAFC